MFGLYWVSHIRPDVMGSIGNTCSPVRKKKKKNHKRNKIEKKKIADPKTLET
jgi:hypothetical protein